MRRSLTFGIAAILALCAGGTDAAQAPARPKLSILAVDTNASFNFLPPPPGGSPTNAEAVAVLPKPVRVQRLRRASSAAHEEVLQTVGGKPGEKEADVQQRPNSARDAAAAQEREKILSTITAPVIPPEELPGGDKKDEKELWINARAKDENPAPSQLPFDTWVLQPREAPDAPPAEVEALRSRMAPSSQPSTKFDFTPSPFDLGPATKAPPAGSSGGRGLLSTKPMDLPLFGGNRDPGSPGFSLPKPAAPPEAVAPVTAKLPAVSPQAPFPSVEFSRDSPFGTRAPPTPSPFGGGASPPAVSSAAPAPLPAPAAAGMRPAVSKPFPTEASRLPPKTREEQAVEKWEKYFDDRKRGF